MMALFYILTVLGLVAVGLWLLSRPDPDIDALNQDIIYKLEPCYWIVGDDDPGVSNLSGTDELWRWYTPTGPENYPSIVDKTPYPSVTFRSPSSASNTTDPKEYHRWSDAMDEVDADLEKYHQECLNEAGLVKYEGG